MYYPYSENKGADQLRSYREADLRLCFFRICINLVFSRRGSYSWHYDDAADFVFPMFNTGPPTRYHSFRS